MSRVAVNIELPHRSTSGPLPQSAARRALAYAEAGGEPTLEHAEALLSSHGPQLERLLALAGHLRDRGAASRGDSSGRRITYSKKVFIPLTTLCRDRCRYCTFVDTPRSLRDQGRQPFLSPEEVVLIARDGAATGCKEALFTLGDRPEDRWEAARDWLAEHGYASTLDYVRAMAELVRDETGLLPHLNPGVMTWTEMQRLRPAAPSMGMMLETTSSALWSQPSGAHYGSPDKDPALRLQVLDDAGRSRIPFTTGILLGIGETLKDRAQSLFAIRDAHTRWGHIQETIVQNFRAKPRTAMQNQPDLGTSEYAAAVAVARWVMGPGAHIQAPPNLTDPEELRLLIRAGIDDWGGVSPVTPDHVNPERPWPQIEDLSRLTSQAGYDLKERLTAHPRWTADPDYWLDHRLHDPVSLLLEAAPGAPAAHSHAGRALLRRAEADSSALAEHEWAHLLESDGESLEQLASSADAVRAERVGEQVTYAVNRNVDASLYDPSRRRGGLTDEDLRLIAAEAAARGATEICVQGAVDPLLPGTAYLDIVDALRTGAEGAGADLHLHAYRPAEILDAAQRLDVTTGEFQQQLQSHGVGSVPGTAARILDDDLRRTLSADTDIPAAQWLDLIRSAHRAGLRSTATMVYGHAETPLQIVQHLLALRRLQEETVGFTEFIAMPLIPQDSPVLVPGVCRMADDRTTRAVHAVARLLLDGEISHIQAAWPKFGLGCAQRVLSGGADDVGGVLLDGTRPEADPEAGRTLSLDDVRRTAAALGRTSVQRSTLYERLDGLGTASP
ncbi:7,8-didemethyl-8-hydroxy-5-deazariboflavin synthase CofG [Nesterenkonia sp. NBAIMH1]|uniref:7,8-didemethyl-8-hydroxy-5-deazariboflavin synthase CofG n=1 Tax=Nesterenkonia sp. NBAIMH1 TaxID=2600320 RepID=UPI0011B7E853|nr:7,8-didemethyl-8-hydroxy-5-deazariboflavin synthase CofG [Nesterenkonia sp. NBAIMH1]